MARDALLTRQSSGFYTRLDSTGVPMRRELRGVASAARTGTARDLLVSMRDLIAKQLDEGVPPRDLASLTKRLMEIRKEIDTLDAATSKDTVSAAAATPDSSWPAA